jgi:hypothetical protein
LHSAFFIGSETSHQQVGRKRVLAIAAIIIAARKLAQYDGGKRGI